MAVCMIQGRLTYMYAKLPPNSVRGLLLCGAVQSRELHTRVASTAYT